MSGKANITKEQLIDALLVRRLTIQQTADLLGVAYNTVRHYAKVYAIDGRLWWKYQQITCPDCGAIIDPECKLDEATRKRLLKRRHVLCEECAKKRQRAIARECTRRWKQEHKERVRELAREYRKRYKERIKAMKGEGTSD